MTKFIYTGIIIIIILMLSISLNVFMIYSSLDDIHDDLKDIKRDNKRFHIKCEQELGYLANQFRYRL